MKTSVLLDIKTISKSFASTKAVNKVNFSVGKGEIRGLIGENGSGKSTLASIIAGIQPADSGSLFLDGKEFIPENPVDANEKGVAMIMQEIGTIGGISVADNLFAGKEKTFSSFGIINYHAMWKQAKKMLENVGAEGIDPAASIDSLNLEQRKVVEIAKALDEKTILLIVDETSNALTKSGRDILYQAIQHVKAKGGSVIFITHDMNEVVSICDSVTILRDGSYITTLYGKDMEVKILKELLVGREMSDNFYRNDYDDRLTDEPVLQVENVSTDVLNNISFSLCKGEILGIGGLADCGMHELGKVIFGLEQAIGGSVVATENYAEIKNTKQAIKNSIGYISKNRDTEALVMKCSIKDNICIVSLKELLHNGIIPKKTERNFVNELAERLKIKMQSCSQYVMYLSGGNKQKVVLAKWLGKKSSILIMDCPTRGIDIGVKEAIYRLMVELKNEGHSLIMISEELPELIGMSDRIIIMKDGKISNTYKRSPEITEDLLIKNMI